ncbi:MAG: PKD domain-containing protein, partial [Planctomycetota bacterium]
MRLPASPILPALAALTLAAPAAAQLIEPPSFAAESAYPYRSGRFVNSGTSTALVHQHEIHVPGAPSLRVFFEEIGLGPDDYVDVISLRDGFSHRITPEEIGKWRSSSAFFNGGRLLLQLYVAPGSKGSFDITHLLVGTEGDQVGDTICFGNDDRVAHIDNRVGRFLNSSGTSACTGWLAGADDCSFSAGHCFPTYTSIAEFMVPPSTPSGALVHPAPEFQFPVDQDSLVWESGGIGFDYALCKLLTNPLGESPAAKFGYFDLGFYYPSSGSTTRISGFGSDSGVDDQTLQTHTGPFFGTSGFALRYTVDTTGGNSGSPVIDETTGAAVGIHTHGGCGSGGGYNSGTSLNLPALVSDWEDNCAQGPPGVPVADFTASVSTVVETQPIQFQDQSTGIPSSWDWDFDGDGTTDSTAKSPTYAYTDPGTYDVSLTVSNSFGSDTVTFTDLVTVTPITAAVMPYSQDFQQGLPASGEWLFTSTNDFGEIIAGSQGSASPGSGSPSLAMASNVDGNYVTNEARLFVNAADYGGLSVSYYFKQTSDEDDTEDGLFISDGVKEVLAWSHQGGPSSWTQFDVDVTALATLLGVDFNEDFHLIFRQRDNYTLGTDGHLIDDVVVTPLPHLAGTVDSISLGTGGTQLLRLEGGLNRA